MIEITFGHISKKPNSTKYSMDSTFTTSVALKERTDLKAPVFIVSFDPIGYNYCSWIIQERDINRYYWIDRVIFVHNNLWEVHCSLDLLATYRNDILQSSARILDDKVTGTYLARIDTNSQFLFGNIRYFILSLGEGIGVYLAGYMLEISFRALFLGASVFTILQIIMFLNLDKIRDK